MFRALGFALALASGADGVTTEVGLARGLREVNPILASPALRISLRTAAGGGVLYASNRLHRAGHRKKAIALRIVATAAYSYAAAHNLRLLRSQNR